MKSIWQIPVVLSVLAVLSACGDTAPPFPSGAPVTETARAAQASLGARGGQVTTTAANGTTYTLIVPPEALQQTVGITLTPVSSMGNAPLAAGVTAAVQMEPSGLQFRRAATLRIGAASGLPAGKRLVGFSTANDGTRFALKLPRVKSGFVELRINHFSDAGTANVTDAEIAGLPALEPITGTPTSDDFNNQIDAAVTIKSTDAEIAAYFETWFAALVKPALLAAENSSDTITVVDAELVFEKWFDARVSVAEASEGRVNVEPFLTDEDALARPIVAKLLLFELNERIESCKTGATATDRYADLYLVNLVQNLALKFGMTTSAGLDAASVGRKLNDCLRVVLDPIKPFTQIVIGSDRSLDARAQVVFAGLPDPQGAGFEFTVGSSGASVKQPSGFSSADGRYTTVFTPTSQPFTLSVQACLVFPGDSEASGVCARQSVSSVVADGIYRGTITVEYHWTSSGGRPAVDGTTSDTIDASVAATVRIDPSKPQIQVVPTNKDATFNWIRSGNVIIASTCQRQVFNTTQTGSSLSLLPAETMFAIQFTDTAYTLSTLDPVGPASTRGTITEQMVVTDRCTDVPPNDPVTRQVKLDTPRTSYLPERISGTGTVVTNPDGSKTISGTSTKTETAEPSPGVTQTTNYTMTWSLVAFF